MTVRQIGKRCLVSAALLALFVVYGPDATPVSGDPTKDVVVTNTSANPVPVTGSISASGTVQAAQSGAWTVRTPTHLGVPATELVALEYHNISTGFSGCTNDDTICSNPQRILPDGGRGAFSIPGGRMLVITDIKWTATAGDAGDEVGVRAANLGYTSSARFDGLGRAAFSEQRVSKQEGHPSRRRVPRLLRMMIVFRGGTPSHDHRAHQLALSIVLGLVQILGGQN